MRNRSRIRNSNKRLTWRRTALAGAVAACFAGNTALANPTGPAVAQGQASFATQGNTLTVTNTPGTVINWQGFSIAGGEITRFIQQSQISAVLNRVSGVNPSTILGTLQSNGRVFLVNPNGITIGPGANIDVAGFLASTLNLSDGDFLAGRMRFTQTPGAGSVVNEGTITTATGGMVYLVGQDVQNSGIIRSPQGEIMLVAGKSVELVDAQTPEVRVQVTAPDNQALNLGQLIAAGGRIGMYGTLVKHSGVADANTAVMGENGKIVFKAVKDVTLDAGSVTTVNGPQGGSITVQAETGTLLASGAIEAIGESGKGGTVQLLGTQVGLIGNASVDTSGQSGGGTVLVGGDFQGKNPDVQNAFRTYFGPDATVKADAITSGDGGKVIVWADDATRYYGAISTRGGNQSGDGGFVEISGKGHLDFNGSVNTTAPNGGFGTLLLDPDNIEVIATGGVATLAQVDQFADPNLGSCTNLGSSCSMISPATINGAGANVVLQANNSILITDAIGITTPGVGFSATATTGNITVNSGITTAATTASGLASGSVNLTSTSGNIVIDSNITTGAAIFANTSSTLTATSGDISASAVSGSVTGAGRLITGNAQLTDNSNGVRDVGDVAKSGNILVTAGTGGINLGGANALTVGTSNVAANRGKATAGNVMLASGGAINASTTPLQVQIGSATGGGTSAANGGPPATGSLTASTSGAGAGIFIVSPSASLVLSNITADGNVVLQGGTDITLSGPVSVTGAGSRFTAQAGRHVTVNAALTTNNGAINLEADTPDALGNVPDKIGQLTITAPVTSNGGKITLIAGGNANTSNSITGPDGNLSNIADNSGFRPIAIVDAGTGEIDLALSRSTDELGIGVTGTITQILGNHDFTPGFGSISNLRTTGPLVIGRATTAGTDGLGAGAQTLTVNRISNTYSNSYIELSQTFVASSLELVAGAGGILLDQPLTTYQPTIITTTGTLTISDPINTSDNDLTLSGSPVTITSNGSINTGSGSCSGTACPVTDIFWDGGGGVDTSWFNALNWSADTLPTASNDVTIASGVGTVLISSAGAVAKSLTANNSALTVSGSGSLTLSNASQITGLFTLSGGTLSGTGSAAITGAGGSLVWSGGTMDSGGTFLLGGGNSGMLSNSLTLNRLFENQGTLTLSNATIGGSGAGSIGNTGLLTATSGTSNIINTLLTNVVSPTIGTIQLSGAGTTLTVNNFPTNDGNISVGNGASFSTGGAALANSATSTLVVNAGNYSTGGSSVTTDVSGNLAVSGALNAGSITLLASGGVTLDALSTVTATGSAADSIVISGASFTNNAGSGALAPGAGRWLVYSTNPGAVGEDRGGLVYDFKQYDATYGVTTVESTTGNGFLYSIAPTITPTLQGTVTKTYDGLTAATLAAGNYATSGIGEIDGDTVVLGNPAAGAYASAHAGSGMTVTASGASTLTSATNGGATVYGYQISGSPASGSVGTINAAQLTASASIGGTTSKTYDGLLVASGATVSGSTNGAVAGDTVALNTIGVSLNYDSSHVASVTKIGATGSVALGAVTSGNTGNGVTGPVAGQTGDYVLAAQPVISDYVASNLITAKALVVTGATIGGTTTKVYDGDTTTAATLTGGSVSGIAGDTLTLDTSGVTLAYDNAHVASVTKIGATGTVGYAIGGSTAGSQTTDYSFAAPVISDYVASNLITAKALVAGLTNTGVTKTYDATTTANFTPTFSVSGLVTGDTAASFTLTSKDYNSSQVLSADRVMVGGLAISGITGANSSGISDYSLISTTASSAASSASITPSVVILTGSRAYDSSTNFGPSAFGAINGVNGETLIVASGIGTVASPKVLAGTQLLTQGSLMLGNGTGLQSNYTLAGGTHTGTITVSATVPFAWDPSGGDLRWENPANWNQGAIPMNGAMANIPGGLGGPVVYSSVSGLTSLKTLSSASGFTITGGTLTLGNSTADISTFSGQPLTLNGGTLNGVGTISLVGTTLDVFAGGLLGGSRTIIGDVNNLAGTVSPGASPGIMTINGNYVQGPSATLLAEIGGTVAGAQYDRLIVTGTVTLAGALDIVLVNGFVPATGTSFTLVQSTAVNGAFSSTPSALPGTSLTTQYLGSTVDVTAGSTATATESLVNTQINQANNAPPSTNTTQNTTTVINLGGPVLSGAYLETTGGQLVPLSSTTGITSDVYTNVNTGQTMLITSNSLPEPGVYVSQNDQLVLVVTIDPATNQLVVLTGSAGSSSMSGSKVVVKKPGVCS